MRRTEAQKVLEVAAGQRCPCGHLHGRHRKGWYTLWDGPGIEVMGACRDCECEGLVHFREDKEA